MGAVVFDLFGTLVAAAPTPEERGSASARLARLLGCEPAVVERFFLESWRSRHDGTLASVPALSAHLVRAVDAPDWAVEAAGEELRILGRARLIPDPTVEQSLKYLHGRGLGIGVLSDASAEIASTWPDSPLAPLVDAAVFSCEAGCVKPARQLYDDIRHHLGVPAQRVLYVGDGGGDELRGAYTAGMRPVAVRRRGGGDTLAFGNTTWFGSLLDAVEQVPTYLAGPR